MSWIDQAIRGDGKRPSQSTIIFSRFSMTPRTFFSKLSPSLVEQLTSMTEQQIKACLDCTFNLMVDYAVGALNGGHIDWSDLNETFQGVYEVFPEHYRTILEARAPEYYGEDEWRRDVAEGDTRLGYDDWLRHQIDAIEPALKPAPLATYKLDGVMITGGGDPLAYGTRVHEELSINNKLSIPVPRTE